MIIESIKLNNIRSYLDQEIRFPKGSVLLSGDIGAGKSTVLLALDFALFGLSRGNLNGASLLRNGQDKGFVELTFTIEDKKVVIRRSLKRTNLSVVQDSGFIVVNGNKKVMTALELKQSVLDLLNYPRELLMKTKSLIYRYTVYTPQEEMKYILIGEKESRIDTLRKVFGIDKYKRIKDNCKILIYDLKDKAKESATFIVDLNEKKLELERQNKSLKDIKNKIKDLGIKINLVSLDLNKNKKDILIYEEKIKTLRDLKKELEINEYKLKHEQELIKYNELDLNKLNKEIKILKSELKGFDAKSFDITLVKRKKEELNSKEAQIKDLLLKLKEIEVRKQDVNKNIESFSSLKLCPICKQNVDDNHKHNILKVENEKLALLDNNYNKIKEDLDVIKKNLDDVNKEYEDLMEKEKKFELNFFKQDNLNEKILRSDNLQENNNKIIKSIEDVNTSILKLKTEIKSFVNVEEEYLILKEKNEQLNKNLKHLEIENATYLKEIETIIKSIEILEEEVVKKEAIKLRLEKLRTLREWLENDFTNLMETMERQIMLKIHHDFNSLFEKWFNILVDSETIKVKLDYEFSPIIDQNGHEIDYEYLSGGEKTAAALAYRLAINQVINNLIGIIKTRGLLILDEPTDGFSNEQLDRIRFVLDELNCKQIIIVSHENKIESFVDSVIRFNKQEHISKITY